MNDPRFPNGRRPDADSERKLIEIRGQAERDGIINARGIRAAGAPLPMASLETGYYGLPLLKEPSWTWEIPLYFFIGGAAGTASVIAGIAHLTGASPKLVRDARRLSIAGAILSPALLISDLGRPERFLAMLRVFKPQSPMSVGVWMLMGFSAGTTAAAFAGHLRD